jgi:hypothetical protein
MPKYNRMIVKKRHMAGNERHHEISLFRQNIVKNISASTIKLSNTKTATKRLYGEISRFV